MGLGGLLLLTVLGSVRSANKLLGILGVMNGHYLQGPGISRDVCKLAQTSGFKVSFQVHQKLAPNPCKSLVLIDPVTSLIRTSSLFTRNYHNESTHKETRNQHRNLNIPTENKNNEYSYDDPHLVTTLRIP